MKKLLSLLLCAALICTVLAGCPRQQAVEEEPETTAAPTEWVLEMPGEEKLYDGVTLKFLARWDQTSAEAAVLTQAAEVFEAKTGGTVEILWHGSSETAGDILQISGEELAASAGNLLDLTEFAAAAGYADMSFSCLTDQVISRCDFLGAIPQTPYISGFYYNREAFESSGVIRTPQTWEEFGNLCAMLSSGGWQPLSINSEDADDLLLMHLTQYLGAEGAQTVAASGGWRSEQAMQASADIFDLVGAGYVSLGGQNKLSLSNSAITYGTNALCGPVEAAADADLSWGMFPYPGVGGAEPVISVDADVLAVSAACSNPRAAFDFIMLLATGEFDQLRADLTMGIPADPGNESPIAGAVEAMQIAQVLETPQAEWTENQLAVIGKLWKGSYQENDSFAAAMDSLYS